MSVEVNVLFLCEVMEFDVVIVGVGFVGLVIVICLCQCVFEVGCELLVCVLEKGFELGVYVLFGVVMDLCVLVELFLDWVECGVLLKQKVICDEFLFLSEIGLCSMFNVLLLECFYNEGNYIISLGEVICWLVQQVEVLEVVIFFGFVVVEVLYGDNGEVIGVVIGDMGIEKDGSIGLVFECGMVLYVRYMVFVEGVCGYFGCQLIVCYKLDEGKDLQVYGIGIKELWQIDLVRYELGLVVYVVGWLLDSDIYGGVFFYYVDGGKVVIGYVVGLDYKNFWLSLFEEFQCFKIYLDICKYLEGGICIGYGVCVIIVGGLLLLLKMVFFGGVLVGCEVGYFNVSCIKGSYVVIKIGMLCVDVVFDVLVVDCQYDELSVYLKVFELSWLFNELQQVKNFKQWFKKGQIVVMLMIGVEQWLLLKLGVCNLLWILYCIQLDYVCLELVFQYICIVYFKFDGVLIFDCFSLVFLSSINYDENQFSYLMLKDLSILVKVNLVEYVGFEVCYCLVGVYEFVGDVDNVCLQINVQNCVYCKICDIKDLIQNIVWVILQGGGGLNYLGM